MHPTALPTELRLALTSQMAGFRNAVLFGFFINLLLLAPTGYMLQVYDRVVNSRSGLTLAMLSILVVGLYLAMAILEWVRCEILQMAAAKFDTEIAQRIFDSAFEAHLRRIPGISTQIFSDLGLVREFIASPALIAILDVPLVLLYLGVIFFINVEMGVMALVGVLVAAALAYLTERSSQPPLSAAIRYSIAAQSYANSSLRNAQVIEAMGMLGGIRRRWLVKQQAFLLAHARASDAAGGYMALSKFVQLTQSSLLLGYGCWLTIQGNFPGGAGMVIVVSILGARVLSPMVQVIALWKHVVGAREGYRRLDTLLCAVPKKALGMALPPPRGLLSVEHVTAAAPNSPTAILRGLSFTLPAGKILAVVGASASGKSSLARVLVGVWPTAGGKVRLDGVEVFSWNKKELGPHLGYLPQDVELFKGTLAENIARFGPVDSIKVEAAARAVGVHETILALPNGYATEIGDEGSLLSGGQRQRIGLARAIYGQPRFLVLDEPNSSLDEAGERALIATLQALKAQGTTIVLITHRSNVLGIVDMLLVLADGQVRLSGPRDQVLAALRADKSPAVPSLTLVGA